MIILRQKIYSVDRFMARSYKQTADEYAQNESNKIVQSRINTINNQLGPESIQGRGGSISGHFRGKEARVRVKNGLTTPEAVEKTRQMKLNQVLHDKSISPEAIKSQIGRTMGDDIKDGFRDVWGRVKTTAGKVIHPKRTIEELKQPVEVSGTAGKKVSIPKWKKGVHDIGVFAKNHPFDAAVQVADLAMTPGFATGNLVNKTYKVLNVKKGLDAAVGLGKAYAALPGIGFGDVAIGAKYALRAPIDRRPETRTINGHNVTRTRKQWRNLDDIHDKQYINEHGTVRWLGNSKPVKKVRTVAKTVKYSPVFSNSFNYFS